MFIKKLIIHNFKKFTDKTIKLHGGVQLLVGGNNSGKSTVLNALTVWEFCKTILIHGKTPDALYSGFSGSGFGITIDDFTPMNIPSFKYLWTNLKVLSSYSLYIDCYWDDNNGIEKHLKIGLALTQERLFIKNMESTVQRGEKIPRVAYLPTFAGIIDKEVWYSPAYRNKLIGQGQAGAVLRNQIVDYYMTNLQKRKSLKGNRKKMKDSDLRNLRETDPFELLNAVIMNVFKGQLYPIKFDPQFDTHVNVEFRRGEVANKRFKPYSNYRARDIMVEGSGFLQWLSVYTFALTPELDCLLLDEPDAHMHCSLQQLLMEQLKNIAGNKQIIIATHSVEIIKSFDYNQILYIDGNKVKYLENEDMKVKVLSGLGTEYFPLLSKIESTKHILFVENESDANFLKIFASKYTRWPENLTIWPMPNKAKDRNTLFTFLKKQIADLKCLSLSDRDNDLYKNTTKDLHDKTMRDIAPSAGNASEIRFRKWRRWEMESYLICPPAIMRLLRKDEQFANKSDEEILQDINHQLSNLSVVINEDYQQSDRTATNQSLFNNDAKAVLTPLCSHYNINKFDIAKEMHADEIFDDVRTLIDEIVLFCQ